MGGRLARSRTYGSSDGSGTSDTPARKASEMSLKHGYREAMHGAEAGKRRGT